MDVYLSVLKSFDLLPVPYVGKIVRIVRIQTYKFKWSNLFYFPVLTVENILIIVLWL